MREPSALAHSAAVKKPAKGGLWCWTSGIAALALSDSRRAASVVASDWKHRGYL